MHSCETTVTREVQVRPKDLMLTDGKFMHSWKVDMEGGGETELSEMEESWYSGIPAWYV